MERILTTKQVAARLGWTVQWTRIRANAGDIPFFRPGKRKMSFRAKDVADFLGIKGWEL